MMKIAILGVTGHVGKNIQYLFARENTDQLYLFSRYRNCLLYTSPSPRDS